MGQAPTKTDVLKMESKAKTDFVAAIVIMVFCILVIVNSIGMPRPSGWRTAPGLVPLLLSVSLFMMALGLVYSSVKCKAITLLLEQKNRFSLKKMLADSSTRKTIYIFGITTGYIALLVGRVPFEVSGFIFLFTALNIFWKTGTLPVKLVTSIVVPVVMTIVFRLFFHIFLPGDTLLELIF